MRYSFFPQKEIPTGKAALLAAIPAGFFLVIAGVAQHDGSCDATMLRCDDASVQVPP